MDLPIHDAIMWKACRIANERLGKDKIGDPRVYFPIMARASWINDVNQVTAFTMRSTLGDEDAPGFTADDAVRTVLGSYWKLELENMLRVLEQYDGTVHKAAKSAIATMAEDVNDFGSYRPHDHLDVLKQVPAVEYKGLTSTGTARTVRETRAFLGTHFAHATTNDRSKTERLSPAAITSLGRGLHSLADFFAHTNFVELLLWQLRDSLDPHMVAYFNRDPRLGFEDDFHAGIYVPLPAKGTPAPEVDHATRLLRGQWYGPSPEETHLASCVFDTNDTVFSLLKMYASHLEEVRPKGMTASEVDMILSVMDLAGTPMPVKMIVEIGKLGNSIANALREVGRKARLWIADKTLWFAEKFASDDTSRALLKSAHAVIAAYESNEAAEWARAGKLRYAAYTLRTDLARSLAKRAFEGEALLPHHTLLSKDHPSSRPDDRVRFQLAAMLATELSARLLVWHFSPDAGDELYEDFIRKKVLVHPHDALHAKGVDAGQIVESARRIFHADWQFGAYPVGGLFGGAGGST